MLISPFTFARLMAQVYIALGTVKVGEGPVFNTLRGALDGVRTGQHPCR